ncbi:MAG: hypothetical protein DIU78_023315 [Pseudomonadota bacterium]
MRRVLTIAALLAACSSRPSPPVTPPDTPPTWEDCDAFCAEYERLNCQEAWGIDPEDGSCGAFCRRALWDGDFCPGNAIGAPNCDELDRRSACDAAP